MINMFIDETKHILNGLKLMKEFEIIPDYTQAMLLNQMISRTKRIIDNNLELAGVNTKIKKV